MTDDRSTPPGRRPGSRRPAPPAAGHGHGHGHGHGQAPPASKQVRRILAVALIPFALAAIVGAALLYPFGQDQSTSAAVGFAQHPVNAEVVSARAGSCSQGAPTGGGGECAVLQLHMQDGPASGNTITQRMPTDPSSPRFAVGDKVVLSYAGANPEAESSYQVVDFQRGNALLVLALVFIAAVLVLGRWQGLASLASLCVSFVILIGFVLPAILAGESPLVVAVTGAGLIMFTALYITHGFSARTSTAVLGTLLSLSLIGLLSALFSATTHLTGLDENTASLIGLLGAPIDARGLLLAGIVIGALGVLDDVTITQTSAVWELREANPTMSWRNLYGAGLRIGRDHVASAVNTLVLAYAGAALPLLLAYSLSGRTFAEVVGAEAVAQEVVRTLVGSIGLIAAVPITTAIAAAVAVREPTHPNTRGPGSAADRIGEGATNTATGRRHRPRPGNEIQKE
ncbi:YibE/F family protein [Parasphingorhabdus pacifica]